MVCSQALRRQLKALTLHQRHHFIQLVRGHQHVMQRLELMLAFKAEPETPFEQYMWDRVMLELMEAPPGAVQTQGVSLIFA